MRRHGTAAAMAMAMAFACVGGAASVARAGEDRLLLARGLWEKKLAEGGGKVVEQPHYPTEPALVWLSAYSVTREERYAEAARAQLEYAHSREKRGMVVTAEGTATRDYQARQVYNFYLAYRLLADGKYLKWADAGARAMIEVIPRRERAVGPGGERFSVFSAGYVDPERPGAEGSLGYFIDVNQNAEVGYAFGLLYHDPASALFRDPVAREIALHETLASMAVQETNTGAVPIGEGEWADKYDTAYGSYATFSWVGSQLLWRDERFERHIRAAARWLGGKTDLSKDSVRWWPTHRDGAEVPDWEAYFRVPLLWYTGADRDGVMVGKLFDRMGGGKEGIGAAPEWWAHFDLMGVPRDYYMGDPGDRTSTTNGRDINAR